MRVSEVPCPSRLGRCALYRCDPDVISFSTVSAACQRAGQWEAAVELLNEMNATAGSTGPAPNVHTYTSTMLALNSAGKYEQAISAHIPADPSTLASHVEVFIPYLAGARNVPLNTAVGQVERGRRTRRGVRGGGVGDRRSGEMGRRGGGPRKRPREG